MSSNQNDIIKNLTALFELDDKSFKSLGGQVKDARKAAESLLSQIRAKKDSIIAARQAEEAELARQKAEMEQALARAQAEELARQKAEAEQAAQAAMAETQEESPSQPEVTEETPVEEPDSHEEQAETTAQPEAMEEEAETPAETVEEPAAETPVEEPAAPQQPTIFIPNDSPVKSKEQQREERLSSLRAQNVVEPRKFVPPTPQKKSNAPTRPEKPQQGGKGAPRGDRQQPAAGTTYVPPQPTGRNRGGQNQRKNNPMQDREGEDKRRRLRRDGPEEVSEAELQRRFKKRTGKQSESRETVRIDHAVVSMDPVPIKTLAEKIGHPASEIVKKLLLLGEFKNINDSIDFEQAELLAIDFGVTLELKLEETMEDRLTAYIAESQVSDESQLVKRAPVVTIMGHVDHGKTSLLDYIRSANVAEKESGGITQHIGAYTIRLHGEKITFIDTPGHAAFTTMRARGAQVTDIVVIVVAADDSIMPQTVESINHAKAAGVPIIVAINKIDKPTANIERVKNDLTKYDLVVEEWGGDVPCVPVSAKTGEGVEDLLEQILFLAEVNELRANPKVPACGTVLEARLDRNLGPVATILVQNGTLKVSDCVVVGSVTGKIRLMKDDKGNSIKQAGPSIPVSVLGLDSVPNAGDQAVVVEERMARSIAEERKVKERIERLQRKGNNLENLFREMTEGKLKELNLIIKADVQGSVEALVYELQKLNNEEVKVSIIHAAVGAVNESDILLATTSGAIIIAFNVVIDPNAEATRAREHVDVRTYNVIYNVIDEINMALKGMLAPKFREKVQGHAEVREVFRISSVGTIAGCYVTDGKIERNAGVRLVRGGIVVYDGKLQSLRRVKDDVREVVQGYECGVGLERYNDIKVGDIIECFVMEQIEA